MSNNAILEAFAVNHSDAFLFLISGYCIIPSPPENGYIRHAISGTLFAGSTVRFRCNTGYNLIGSHTVTCQADRTWSPNVPTCEASNGNLHFLLKHLSNITIFSNGHFLSMLYLYQKDRTEKITIFKHPVYLL